MTTELLIRLFIAIATVISILISAYVVPWLKTKVDKETLSKIQRFIEFAVRYAEQTYMPEEYEKKKEFVEKYIADLINEKFPSLNLTYTDINVIIESTVNKVKYSGEYTK